MITLYILGILIVLVGTIAFMRSEPEPQPIRIKRELPEHIRRHQAAQERGEFDTWNRR